MLSVFRILREKSLCRTFGNRGSIYVDVAGAADGFIVGLAIPSPLDLKVNVRNPIQAAGILLPGVLRIRRTGLDRRVGSWRNRYGHAGRDAIEEWDADTVVFSTFHM